MYCENYKEQQISQTTETKETESSKWWNSNICWIQIGSSTWATHLLKMNNIPIYRKTPIHGVAKDHFKPMLGRSKSQFLKTAESFIVARDPFERLLSSYKVRKKE